MSATITLHFMHGLGNQFVLVDATGSDRLNPKPSLIETILSHSAYPIDQILFLLSPTHPDAHFDYLIYNQDGSRAEQCGNGARCVSKFIHDFHPELAGTAPYKLHTSDGKLMRVHYHNDDSITAILNPADFEPSSIGLNAELTEQVSQKSIYFYALAQNEFNKLKAHYPQIPNSIPFYAVSMGNPHMVINTKSLNMTKESQRGFENLTIEPLALVFQNQPNLFRYGVNVNFIEIINNKTVNLRTYERGAGETLACGSGACAVFACLKKAGVIQNQLTIHLKLGDLKLRELNGGEIEMIGPATYQTAKEIETAP